MSVKIAWKQNILVTDFQLLKSLLVVLGFGSQTFVCGFSRQNICSVGCNGLCGKHDVFHRVDRTRLRESQRLLYIGRLPSALCST